jgi:hypothetical protein
MGNHEFVDLAEVLWPDGKRERLMHLAAAQFYVVLEDQGVVTSRLPERKSGCREI